MREEKNQAADQELSDVSLIQPNEDDMVRYLPNFNQKLYYNPYFSPTLGKFYDNELRW